MGHACFGVSHRRGWVAVDGTEVSLRLHHRGVHLPVLRHPHHGWVDDGLAVRVVVAGSIATDFRTLEVLLVWSQVEVVHRDEDASLRWFETITNIGERPVHDCAHRVGEVGVLEFAFDVEIEHCASGERRPFSWVGLWKIGIVAGRVCPGIVAHKSRSPQSPKASISRSSPPKSGLDFD